MTRAAPPNRPTVTTAKPPTSRQIRACRALAEVADRHRLPWLASRLVVRAWKVEARLEKIRAAESRLRAARALQYRLAMTSSTSSTPTAPTSGAPRS